MTILIQVMVWNRTGDKPLHVHVHQWWSSSLTCICVTGSHWINSPGPSDAIWKQRSWSSLVELMACEWNSNANRPGPILQWRHNERGGVSNHQPHNCLFNRLFRHRSNKISKLRVAGLCEGNSPVTGEFPTQRTSNAENVSIWWRHHKLNMFAQSSLQAVLFLKHVNLNSSTMSIAYAVSTLYWPKSQFYSLDADTNYSHLNLWVQLSIMFSIYCFITLQIILWR